MIGGLLAKLENATLFFVSHLSIIFVFATLYWVLHEYVTGQTALVSSRKKKDEFTWLDYFYFSIVTQTTVGYGDIVTEHPVARLVNIIQLLSVYGVVTYSMFGGN
jgi:hypothetical protein